MDAHMLAGATEGRKDTLLDTGQLTPRREAALHRLALHP